MPSNENVPHNETANAPLTEAAFNALQAATVMDDLYTLKTVVELNQESTKLAKMGILVTRIDVCC